MPRKCAVCAHPRCDEVDRELAATTEPKRRLAAQFGLSPAAVVRHVKRHITRHAVASCPDPERELLA